MSRIAHTKMEKNRLANKWAFMNAFIPTGTLVEQVNECQSILTPDRRQDIRFHSQAERFVAQITPFLPVQDTAAVAPAPVVHEHAPLAPDPVTEMPVQMVEPELAGGILRLTAEEAMRFLPVLKWARRSNWCKAANSRNTMNLFEGIFSFNRSPVAQTKLQQVQREIGQLRNARARVEGVQKRLVDLRNYGLSAFSYMEQQRVIARVQGFIDQLTRKIDNINFEIGQLGVAATALEMSGVDTGIKVVMIDDVSRADLEGLFTKVLQEIQNMKDKRNMTGDSGYR